MKKDFAVLIPETEALWHYLKGHEALRGFVLLGGSGLALQIQHRLSEDLDFVWTGVRLPVSRLSVLIREAETAGFTFAENDNPGSVQEFEIAGMDLHDYQQDYLVNGSVKVTFFCADAALAKILPDDPASPCRIATVPEIFDSKALVSAARSKSRDWFDLFVLMRDHGFTLDDYVDAFVRGGIASQSESGLTRLCSGVPQSNDEGFEGLLGSPPDVEELAQFFRGKRDEFEVSRAAKARLDQQSGGQKSPGET